MVTGLKSVARIRVLRKKASLISCMTHKFKHKSPPKNVGRSKKSKGAETRPQIIETGWGKKQLLAQ